MRWEELVVSWNCQSWSRILCIGNVYQRVVKVLALISLKWFTALASAEQLKASTFQKIETTMILLDNFDTVAGAHWCKVWTLVHPMGWHLTQPALLVYQPFSQIADTSSAYRCMTLCFLLLSGAVALICDFILDVIQDVIASSVVWHFVVSKKRDQTLWSSKHIFVQWSLTCDYYPYDFVAQLPKRCWNFIWPGVLSHKSGRYPDHVKAWIQWCLA